MAKIQTAKELVRKLKELNPGVVIVHRDCRPNTISFGQFPELLTWPEGFDYDEKTGKIKGLGTPITACKL